MINITILHGTWRQVRADISTLCDRIDAAPEAAVPMMVREMDRLLGECEHLRMLLREADPSMLR